MPVTFQGGNVPKVRVSPVLLVFVLEPHLMILRAGLRVLYQGWGSNPCALHKRQVSALSSVLPVFQSKAAFLDGLNFLKLDLLLIIYQNQNSLMFFTLWEKQHKVDSSFPLLFYIAFVPVIQIQLGVNFIELIYHHFLIQPCFDSEALVFSFYHVSFHC